MAAKTPLEVAQYTAQTGMKKAQNPVSSVLILGFLAGAFIALGFLLDIRVIASAPAEWGSIATFIGAAVFPVGLILVLIGGGELLTGNMMAVPLAAITRKITPGSMLKNLLLVTLGNLLGALFVAFFFGHVLGLTADGVYLTKLVDMAGHKLHDSFFQAFISGIGCNWLVALAVWLSYAADTMSGKILGIWFPTMAFVAIGFQHVVANMFLIPAAIFEGHYTWGQYVMNFIPVWLGNLTGGALFVAAAYWMVYLRKTEPAVKSETTAPASAAVSSVEADARGMWSKQA
ncbi:formate/nitrite transporter family protein [Paenibacillus silvae]|uniref:formate/nitrite transporter family protein n=1 Tax=Paenibacillus silvae TaxID=1325358 RepID=UPI002005B3F9|nr:formate/nitrite transporter family protein [Paenibacillus silvae]MCK6075799.1 formate/nitrite transporter family protein [Paenibacillus silvae]MCK6150187.1 formate/nitrite transporter family protein [Paenibacillus silvae]MCK6268485.1 formate/nitrite transporter family protein [Paenibacillus silvae]